MIELVLGGVRSGKSQYAKQQAMATGKKVVYIATAEARDTEMQARIKRHRDDRPVHWQTIEEPIKLAMIINNSAENTCLLVDCLTLWLSNILFDKRGQLQQTLFETETNAFFDALSTFSGQLILVSNEIGLGGVSMELMTRRFMDESGLLHQQIGKISDRVVLVTAGIPLLIK